MTTKAIVGFDGLSIDDVTNHDFPAAFDPLRIETPAHTCPSWNAIFTGRDRAKHEAVYDFFKLPDDAPSGTMLAEQSDDRWAYHELKTDRYPWERPDVPDVAVVSAPVVLPTYSNLPTPPDESVTWPTEHGEIRDSVDTLARYTRDHDRVITIFPHPDKANHRVTEPSTDYTRRDRSDHLKTLADVARTITRTYDEWVFISDHGKPAARECPNGCGLWIPSHVDVGVVASNAFDTADLTNRTVYDKLIAFLKDT